MAVASGEINVTREQVALWIRSYRRSRRRGRVTLREFLVEKLATVDHGETMVDTGGRDSLGDETPLVDMIMADLESYGASSLA